MMDLFQQAFFHTHLSACSDTDLSYPRTKHHTTTMPQFCITEGPQFYSSEWWNFLTGTVLCEKTIMPIVSWDGIMTLLKFCVEELQHYCCAWQNYISVCVRNTTVIWHCDGTTTQWQFLGTTTVLQFCQGNYYIAIVLCAGKNFYNSVWWT